MPDGNSEVVRRAMEAWNRRDRDAWLLLHDSEFEFRADPGWPESETVCGREAVWDFTVRLADAWEDDAFDMLEVIECGDDRLAARFSRPVRGKASGIADVLDYWAVCTFRRGKLLRQVWFANRNEALAAARLSE